VYLWSAVQGDHVRLFELGDVVTLPIELVDAAAEPGWPAEVGIEMAVTVTVEETGRWATTPAGMSVRTRLAGPVGAAVPVRAGLEVELETSAMASFVTGTVRRIEMASISAPQPDEPAEPVRLSERWTLSETPVAPVRFREPFRRDGSEVWDQGMLIHLELFKPPVPLHRDRWPAGTRRGRLRPTAPKSNCRASLPRGRGIRMPRHRHHVVVASLETQALPGPSLRHCPSRADDSVAPTPAARSGHHRSVFEAG
jgi:hypothetical protein